jgi:hypothetical protein
MIMQSVLPIETNLQLGVLIHLIAVIKKHTENVTPNSKETVLFDHGPELSCH